MFDFLKKKKAAPAANKPINNTLFAVATGELVAIDKVSDPVFSQKMMGDGYAVLPTAGEIHAPIEGKILSVFPTKHAVGLKMDNGLEILLHMGVDTVELKGAPFTIKVTEGQEVTAETVVAVVDLAALEAAGKANDMIVIITNMEAVAEFNLTKTGPVTAGESIGQATAK